MRIETGDPIDTHTAATSTHQFSNWIWKDFFLSLLYLLYGFPLLDATTDSNSACLYILDSTLSDFDPSTFYTQGVNAFWQTALVLKRSGRAELIGDGGGGGSVYERPEKKKKRKNWITPDVRVTSGVPKLVVALVASGTSAALGFYTWPHNNERRYLDQNKRERERERKRERERRIFQR